MYISEPMIEYCPLSFVVLSPSKSFLVISWSGKTCASTPRIRLPAGVVASVICKEVPQSGLGHHELLALQLQLLVAGEDEDRLEGARHEEHPHGQLPDEHIVREVSDVLGGGDHMISYCSCSYLGGVEKQPWQGKTEKGDEKDNRDSDHLKTCLGGGQVTFHDSCSKKVVLNNEWQMEKGHVVINWMDTFIIEVMTGVWARFCMVLVLVTGL